LNNWTERIPGILKAYEPDLLRAVAGRLCKPRNQWPIEELIERSIATLENTPVLDRRLRELAQPSRLVLALMAHSQQPRWRIGQLIEMTVALTPDGGLEPILDLLEAGLLFPDLPEGETINAFNMWLAHGGAHRPPAVIAPPLLLERLLAGYREGAAIAFDEALPPSTTLLGVTPLETDGLDWPLRLSVLWQQVSAAPLRRTQQQDLFKRDLDRLHADPLLATTSSDALVELPDPGMLAVAWSQALGLIENKEGDLVACAFDESWQDGLPRLLVRLLASLSDVAFWNPAQGWQVEGNVGNPYPSAYLLTLLLLSRAAADQWTRPADLEEWMLRRHPFWAAQSGDGAKSNGASRPPAKTNPRTGRSATQEPALAVFLLGLAYPLRLVQIARDPAGEPLVRLSDLGRWVLGLTDNPPLQPTFPQTLLVQPNLEILAYRQGLAPDLISRLGRIATWKTLGPACTLLLEPTSVYRALEQGETSEGIVRLLESRGMKGVPTPVLEALRTWSNKRQRITIFPSAALFEFPSAAELTDAMNRGLNAVRLTDRLAVVPAEKDIDYRHFRLMGTRDFLLPPDRCVEVQHDGVTLSIDLSRSDLLLETEMQRFSELSADFHPPGRRIYRMTPATVQAARKNGMTLAGLQTWFLERTGLPLSPAAHLFLTAGEMPPLDLRRQLVLHVPFAEIADGLQQWPATRDLVKARLGPMTLVVLEKDIETLRSRCAEINVKLQHGDE